MENEVKQTESRKYGTNLGCITSTTLRKDNKTGYKGVWYDPKRHTYWAYISLRKERHYLGQYRTLDEAVAARQAGEQEFYAPIIAEVEAGKRG